MHGNEKVGITAIGCALRRADTDIQYAPEIFKALTASAVSPDELAIARDIIPPHLTPIFEARHKLIDAALKSSGITQVLDLAAGLTPRGLAMTKDSAIIYVETDLPGIVEQKREIVKQITKKEGAAHSGLYIEVASAMELAELERATRHFGPGPIAIVHEGLFRYLTHTEKTVVINNICALLKKYGGLWMTSDVPTMQNAYQRGDTKVGAVTGMNIDSNLFATVTDARDFYERFGFTTQDFPHKSIQAKLVSPERLGLSQEVVSGVLDELCVFVMKPI